MNMLFIIYVFDVISPGALYFISRFLFNKTAGAAVKRRLLNFILPKLR